jgi:enterochelin esterase-like enzyme
LLPGTPLSPSLTPPPPIPHSPAPSQPPTTSTPTALACWAQGGKLETGSLPTGALPEPLPDPLEFRVYLPPCYAEEPGRRYPSLYLIHGQSYTDDQWDRLGADEIAGRLIAAREVVPFLIVMPRDRRWDQPDEDHFGQAVAELLVPWIDAHYRTLANRPYRAVGGLSRGAGWAVHLALSRWELFGALGAHSLPVFWADTPHVKEWLNAIPLDQMPRIYMDNPNNDRQEIMKSSIWFEKLLTQRGIPHEWYLFTGYHDEKYWQAHVEQYLRWYAEGWEE